MSQYDEEKQQGYSATDSVVGAINRLGDANVARQKNAEWEKHQAVRSAMMLAPGARFAARVQLGNIWTVQENMSLAELIDTLCLPHSYTITVEVTNSTRR